MLTALFCLLVVGSLLHIGENVSRRRILSPENQRKLVHITTASFIAFWPWILTWHQIQIIGTFMLLGVLANRSIAFFSFNHKYRQRNYGDIFLALAVIIAPAFTHNKVYFAIAMLSVALADGLAAVAGTSLGQKWQYKVFGQTKTIVGTMTFWLIALCVIGTGALFVRPLLNFTDYLWLLILLPPALALLENAAKYGSDNLIIPIAVIAAFGLAH
jgi:dolichol kinase